MIKRRKDEGFTLIELMIVIAVIGILAVVLVPRVGGIKTAAKSAGIDTNIRAVQAFVQSRVSYWSTQDDYDAAEAGTEITNALGEDSSEPMRNPIDGLTTTAFSIADVGDVPGEIYVVIPDTQAGLLADGIEITGIDNNGSVFNRVTIMP